jgi:RNA polymerase sigma-70 factor (ECF subfamily)
MDADEFKKQVFILKDKLFRLSNRLLGNIPEAEDITQEVMLKLWEMRGKLEQYQSIEALAMTTTRNLSLDRIRYQKVRWAHADDVKPEETYIDNPAERSDIETWMKKIMAQLPETQQTILHLRDAEGMEFEEIAPILGMNVETIRVNLSRARKKVREELQKIMEYGLK